MLRIYRHSGLSPKEWCRAQGVALSTLGKWLKLEKEHTNNQVAQVWAPVAAPVMVSLQPPVQEEFFQKHVHAIGITLWHYKRKHIAIKGQLRKFIVKVTLKIWVNWGRDQVKVLNSLIRKSFSADTGINVRVEQVNASIVQGVVSNDLPDLYLHLSRTEPVNLAMRVVIYDLSNLMILRMCSPVFKRRRGALYLSRRSLCTS